VALLAAVAVALIEMLSVPPLLLPEFVFVTLPELVDVLMPPVLVPESVQVTFPLASVVHTALATANKSIFLFTNIKIRRKVCGVEWSGKQKQTVSRMRCSAISAITCVSAALWRYTADPGSSRTLSLLRSRVCGASMHAAPRPGNAD
jgi:hypothetical protein